MLCGAGGKDVAAPKPYPEEFRQDVVRVARNRGPGVTVERVAADFGVHDAVAYLKAFVARLTRSAARRPRR